MSSHSHPHTVCIGPVKQKGKMASGMRWVCQGRLGPFVPSVPLSRFPGEHRFNLSPIEFRQVMGCLGAEAIFSHPQSSLSSLKSPHRLEPALESVFMARLWGVDFTSKTTLTAKTGLKFCSAARLSCEQSLQMWAPRWNYWILKNQNGWLTPTALKMGITVKRYKAQPPDRPSLRTSFYRQQVGQTSQRRIYAGFRQWDVSLIDLRNRCRRHPSSSCLFAKGLRINPEGRQ